MPTPPKKTNKSITFTPEAADQTLLVAIEAALTEAQYDSFSDLCKQALQQTLLAAEPTQSVNHDVSHAIDFESALAPIQQQVDRLEAKLVANQSQQFDQLEAQLRQVTQQLEELGTKSDRGFSSWKQPTNNPTTEYLNQLTSQLIHLTTQVEAIETHIAQQFADLQSQLNQAPPTLPVPVPTPPPSMVEVSSPLSAQTCIPTNPIALEPIFVIKEPVSKTAALSPESDPILSRLSSLLEDF
ncbi:hypothetical protein H6F90_07800 [Trichocoleus sp. FACHB-591]|uniref:hypothetical protein n=1 Tax=Trichocoleus sp. FACHB-591 TaxID=2692872 RepID=UPI001684922A|nr:hypothetical protein [Trichocoleus sp. FACHB-591]MBD2095059.1 hypothetical protein [Trichocoleus sp. FACHB-591]